MSPSIVRPLRYRWVRTDLTAIAMSIRSTNVYEERSLGVYEVDDTPADEPALQGDKSEVFRYVPYSSHVPPISPPVTTDPSDLTPVYPTLPTHPLYSPHSTYHHLPRQPTPSSLTLGKQIPSMAPPPPTSVRHNTTLPSDFRDMYIRTR